MLELKGVKKVYTTKAGNTAALDGLSISFPSSGLVFITGKSGSGKTTLLNVIGGLDGIDKGDIIINGKKFSEFKEDEYNSYRNTFVGFIFQEYNLLSEYTVEKNIRIATELQGVNINVDRVNELLSMVDLQGLNNRLPSQLSGGQKQRVAIARALVKNPQIIMADEPTGALDSVTGIQVMDTLKNLSKERLVIVVSHDLELAEKYADRIIRLIDGKVVEDVTLSDKTIEGNVFKNDDEFIVKSGAKLTSNETTELVKAIEDKKNIVLSDDIKIRQKEKTNFKCEEKVVDKVNLVSSKMKYKSAAELGLKSLKVKPLRLAFTILLSVIAFAVFGLFDTVASYNNSKVISNLISGGDYSAISLRAENVGDINTANVNFSNEEIDNIKRQTGLNFRPIYDFNDKEYFGLGKDSAIAEIVNNNYTIGKDYYAKSFSGFIEFGADEITEDGIIDKNGFNYKLVYGKYPRIERDSKGVVKEDSLNKIAISLYMAESICYWLNGLDVENFYSTPEELVEGEAVFTINKKQYKIVGIIDCGDIPDKYEILQTKISASKDTKALAQDFKTFINAGAHLFAFVDRGYVDTIRAKYNRITNYYTTEAQFVVEPRHSLSTSDSTCFYDANEISKSQVIMFPKSQSEGGTTEIYPEIQKDEVLISVEDFQDVYSEELQKMDYEELVAKVKRLADPQLDEKEKDNIFADLVTAFKKNNKSLIKVIQVFKQIRETNVPSSHPMKVVGFYLNVNSDIPNLTSIKPLAINKETMSSLGVCTNQGYYSKIIAPLTRDTFGCNLLRGADYIAEKMTIESGFRFQWNKNTILETIDENGEMIKDFTGLILIIALVLAVFSVFMLFNYISTSIVSKRQSIGVLRALGSNGRDIFSMFITESLVISLINAILASIVAGVGCIFVNLYIRNVMNIAVDFAVYGIRQVIIITLASIVTGIISSLLPIIKICKEKPVELISKP